MNQMKNLNGLFQYKKFDSQYLYHNLNVSRFSMYPDVTSNQLKAKTYIGDHISILAERNMKITPSRALNCAQPFVSRI